MKTKVVREMLWNMAWRNVLRNRKRTFLTALTIFLAAMVVGMAQGFSNGAIETYILNYIEYQTGHIRIVTREFLNRERFLPVDEINRDADALKAGVEKIPGVQSVQERIRFGILLGHGNNTLEALGMGVDLFNNSFKLKDRLLQGRLEGSGIYLGSGLAKKLGAKIGEEILLAAKTSEGGLNGIKVRVNGIFQLGITGYDRKIFFLGLADAKKLLKIHQGTTELYVFLRHTEFTDPVLQQIKPLLPAGVVAQTYREQMGAWYDTLNMGKIIYVFLDFLILFLASFVVINTMMMAVFERLREIGTLKALGWSRRELFINFTLEGAMIGALGGIAGSIMGYLIIVYFSGHGINFQAALQNVDMPIEYVVRPTLHLAYLLGAMAMSILVPALAALIPARYAMNLTPAEALRK